MAHTCEIKQQAAQHTLVVRKHTAGSDLPAFFGAAYGAVMQYLGALGEAPVGPPFALYHNMDMQDLDLEIGFPFALPVGGGGEILAGEIPGGKAAGCLHVGPYDQVGAAYRALQKWIEAGGYTPSGVAYESYLNDPQTTPAAELQTQVVFPLK